MKLIVVRRSADFMVHLEGDTRIWDCGATIVEALGKWVLAHGMPNGIEVVPFPPIRWDRYMGPKSQYTGNAVDIPSR